jgi:hypothetical protein
VAMLTETARPTAVMSTTAESGLGALSWFASMCAAFGLLGLALVRDRVVSWLRPSPRRVTTVPRRRVTAGRARPPYVTRCGRPPAR